MTIRWTLVLSACALTVACGRLGFDPLGDEPPVTTDGAPINDGAPVPGDAPLPVVDAAVPVTLEFFDNRPTSVEVRAAGRFSLVFDAAHLWQVSEWRDLSNDPAVDLVNDDMILHHDVLQSPLRVDYGPDVLSLDNATSPTFELVVASFDRVEFKTEWLWTTTDGNTVEGEATHLIRIDGTWRVEGELKSMGGNLPIDRVYFATANIDQSLGWQSDEAPDGSSYSYTRNEPGGSRFQVARLNNGNLQTDGDGNYHWTQANITATPDGWTTFWNNRVWPATP